MSIASELTALQGYIGDAYGAVGDKGGTVPADKNMSNLSSAIGSIPSGGGDVVNGIISRFKATSDAVDANTFVEFVNTITVGTDTRLVATSNAYYNISAVLVDDDKVFIAHRSGNYLYGIVCTISGSTVTPGTDTQLSTTADSYYDSSLVLIDTNKIFIAHRGASYHLNGMVCTISDTSITVDTDIELSSVSSSYDRASAVLLDTNKVFISHRGSNSNLYGMVCTISGSTITAGTDTRLVAASSAYRNSSAVLVDTNKVFVSHSGSSTDYDHLYGIVCTISGTTITPGNSTQIAAGTQAASYVSLALVETNKVFILHRSGNYLYGIVCTISGTTITIGKDTLLVNNSSAADYAKAVLVGTDKVLVAHRGTSNYLYGMVCTAPEITVKAATTQFSVAAITKSACTSATEGEVWVLN